jgi:hypothetical protein
MQVPHDINGKEVKVGDIVQGMGYNIPHRIVGQVLQVDPHNDACNLTVATIARGSRVEGETSTVMHEYGQCDHFQVMHRDE